MIAPLGLGIWDWIGLGLLGVSILYFNVRVETESDLRPSTHVLTRRFRHQWMQVMVTRENRIVDAVILDSLQASSRFFATGLMIAIGGVGALISRPEVVNSLGIGVKTDLHLWNLKLFFVALLLANGFFKFIWAGRVFGYCAIVLASTPEEDQPTARKTATRAATLNITASRSFNRGLRLIYFALAGVTWLFGALPFIIAVIIIDWIIWRREFLSESRSALLEE